MARRWEKGLGVQAGQQPIPTFACDESSPNTSKFPNPLSGQTLPENNGYGLYAAISNALDSHLPAEIAIASVGGPSLGKRRLQVTRETRLRIRTPAEQIGAILPLAGKWLNVAGHEIGLGVPEVHALTPAPRL